MIGNAVKLVISCMTKNHRYAMGTKMVTVLDKVRLYTNLSNMCCYKYYEILLQLVRSLKRTSTLSILMKFSLLTISFH